MNQEPFLDFVKRKMQEVGDSEIDANFDFDNLERKRQPESEDITWDLRLTGNSLLQAALMLQDVVPYFRSAMEEWRYVSNTPRQQQWEISARRIVTLYTERLAAYQHYREQYEGLLEQASRRMGFRYAMDTMTSMHTDLIEIFGVRPR